MKKYVIFITILCIALCMGCTSKPKINLSDSVPQMLPEPNSKTKKPEKIGIYVDVTPSMQGFLGMDKSFYKNLVKETKYMVCLDEINNIVSSQYINNQINYYRVDTPLWRTKENVLVKAKNFDYYINSSRFDADYECIDLIKDDGEEYKSFCLANALLNCQEDDFSLIVTDMYENKAASDEVIKALKANMCLEDGSNRTIGIVGIKSEFAGYVYDITNSDEAIEYGLLSADASLEDVQFRQFYIIAIGNYDIVSEFCKHLRENMNLGNLEIKSAVFYEEELYGIDCASFNKCFTRYNGKRYKLFEDEKIWINNRSQSINVYEYINKTEKLMDIVVGYNVNNNSLETELLKGERKEERLPNFKEKKELIDVPFCFENQKNAIKKKNSNIFELDDNLRDVFDIKKLYYCPKEKLLYVWFQITNSDLPIGTIKLYGQIKKQDSVEKEQRWEWVDDWNLTNWEYDCEKTKYLKEYFNTMEAQIPIRNQIMVEFVFYINIK